MAIGDWQYSLLATLVGFVVNGYWQYFYDGYGGLMAGSLYVVCGMRRFAVGLHCTLQLAYSKRLTSTSRVATS